MLEARNLGKTYNGRPVLRDVSLQLKRGEVVGLFGPNGAGKTSCFYIMAGLIKADYGNVILDGADLTNAPMYQRSRSGLGYLPQENSIFRGLNVEQNIMAVLETIEKDPVERKSILRSLLAEFSITHLRYSPAVTLSGGERRRLEIARALAAGPQYILLDEPLAGVDPVSVDEIAGLVRQLKEKDIGVLITDHNVRETLGLVDRAYILHEGKILCEGAADDIVNDEIVRRVYLGDAFVL